MTRFTEIGKWDDAWFRALKPSEKLLFLFLIENCNNAGFYEVDRDAIAFKTGLSDAEIDGALVGLARGIVGASGWLWVRRFLKHQKNTELNPSNGAHRQIISLLSEQIQRFSGCPEFKEFIAPYKGLLSPIGICKGTGTLKRNGSYSGPVVEEILAAYPRKIDRANALKAISALKRTGPEKLLLATRDFANAVKGAESPVYSLSGKVV